MSKIAFPLLLCAVASIFLISCRPDDDGQQDDNPPVSEDYFYYFERDGHHNVANTGQICRNLIVQDFEILTGNLAGEGADPIAYDELYKYYDNNAQTIDGPTLTQTDLPLVYTTIKEISAIRDLKQRVNGPYAPQIHGEMENICTKISDYSNDPDKLGTYDVYIEEETGYDLREMFKLNALGAAMLQHGLYNYFRYVEFDHNDTIVSFPGANWYHYTWMEHHLDEAFGYYGAARRFHDFTDEEVAGYEEGLNYKDNVDVDGKIDFKTEYNYYFARFAAQRDIDSQTGTDFSRGVFDAFYEARVAVVNKDTALLVQKKAVILENWEKSITATIIHHINETITEMNNLKNNPGASPEMFYRQWMAMYKFTEMVRYNYANTFSNYQEILDTKYITSEVPFPKAIVEDVSKVDAYAANLLEVRAIIQGIYNFDDSDVEAW